MTARPTHPEGDTLPGPIRCRPRPTNRQLEVMYAIHQGHDFASGIAQYLGVDKGAMGGSVQRMVDYGWIERVGKSHIHAKPRTMLGLTRRGLALLRSELVAVRAWRRECHLMGVLP